LVLGDLQSTHHTHTHDVFTATVKRDRQDQAARATRTRVMMPRLTAAAAPVARPGVLLLPLLLIALTAAAPRARALQIVLLDHAAARGGGPAAPAGPATAAPLAADPRAPRWVTALYADGECGGGRGFDTP